MNRWWSDALEGFSNQLAQRYGHPIYLVGSAIEEGANARDVDLVCIIPHREYTARFGPIPNRLKPYTPEQSRIAAELGKMSSQGSELTGLHLDLKIQSDAEANNHLGRPRVRLDTLPFETP